MHFNWDENPDLNITPLVDIMLVLMAILMVTAPVMEYEEQINLPQGAAQKATHKIADLSIRVDAKKNIYIKNERFSFDTFADDFALQSEKYPKDTVVYIKADKELKYNDVMYILKVIKESGFSKVSLVTNG
jgi:biopolymer transport protein ExbD